MSERPYDVDSNIFARPIQPSDDLRSALLQGGWQPMETAPKDGTFILVYDEWVPAAVCWDDQRMFWALLGAYSDAHFANPKCWMPLLDPPIFPS